MSEEKRLTDYTTDQGLGFEKLNRKLNYLYGLSDFWATTFSDTETINLLMETTSFEASEIYNRFLQLAANISLEDIQTKLNSQIELVYLTDSELVSYPSTYRLEGKISKARYIANRPFLPTSSLEEGVDFLIDGPSKTITLARPLDSNGFVYRIMPDGSKKYALWLVDVKIDNEALQTNYASLLQIEEPSSITDSFKNFVYGMYYLFVHGPTLDLIRRGLNIALGIPISRDNETVLEIRKYLETDQYVIITTLNSYVIPYGLSPSVLEGDVLEIGTGLANWVEIKDYLNDGEWWINLRLPTQLIPSLPVGVSRYATLGSTADILMREYLKTHTFLVNIKTTHFKNLQEFTQLSDIIHAVKPSYTTPIYIWSVDVGTETLSIIDTLSMPNIAGFCDHIGDPIERFYRNSNDPLTRGCPGYTRFSAPAWANNFVGRNPDLNGTPQMTGIGQLDGFINQGSGVRVNDEYENAWVRALWGKGGPYYYFPKSYLSRVNNVPLGIPGTGFNYLTSLFPGYRVLWLYCTTEPFVDALFAAQGLPTPLDFVFTLFAPQGSSDGINVIDVNGALTSTNLDMINHFSTYMVRNPLSINFGANVPPDLYKTFTPLVGDIQSEDFLVFTRNRGDQIGVYWATTNINYNVAPYWEHYPTDDLNLTISGGTTRGLACETQPVYMMRDWTLTTNNYVSTEIDSFENDGPTGITVDPTYEVKYTDTQNTNIPLVRSGVNLTFRRDWT